MTFLKHHMPTKVIFGRKSIKKLYEEVESLNLDARRTAVICTGSAVSLGYVEEVKNQLKGKVAVFSSVIPDPTVENALSLIEEVKEFDPTLLVAIGGGSPIDVAKVISVMLKNEGDITEFIGVPEAFKNPGVPLIAIPTTAGSGSEVTPYAVLTDFEKVRKAPLISRHLFPVLAIDDPELTVTMSPILTASTGVDALTHAIESLLSKRATPISKLYSMKAIKLVFRFLPRAYGNPKDLQAREGMMLASLLGGMAITDAGAGLVHTLAHILGVLYKVPHGIANGVFLLPVLKFYGLSASSALEELSEYLGLSGWKEFSKELFDLLSFVGIPSKLSQFGVKEYDIAQFVSLTMEKKFLMGHLPRIPSEREIRVLIEEML